MDGERQLPVVAHKAGEAGFLSRIMLSCSPAAIATGASIARIVSAAGQSGATIVIVGVDITGLIRTTG